MAQEFKDFNSDTLNTIPSDFVSRWVTPSAGTGVVTTDAGSDAAMGGQVFRIEGTGGGFTFERVGFEITSIAGSSKDRMAALLEGLTTDINKVPSLILRGSGASAGARSGYMLWLRGGSDNFQIRRVTSGSSTTVASGTLPSSVTTLGATANVEYSVLDDGAGNVDIAATVWEIGESKPASPQLTYTDTSPLAVGWAGVGTASADDMSRAYYIGYVGVGTNGDLAPTEPVVSGPSITAADLINSEGETVTFTLANNAAAPTSATLNGTDVGALTDQGSGVYSYTAPLIADDATASLVVSVDSTTASATIAYANSYPYTLVTHGAPDTNSIFAGTQFATNFPVEWGVVTDYNSSIVTVDHAAMDAAEDELNDVALHSTEVAEGTTTATYKYFVPESGATGTWQAEITVDDWPFGKRIRPKAAKNWTWGKRHPKTGMRVRVYE